MSVLKSIRHWLRDSRRVHLRENRIADVADLVTLIDRFLENKLSYPLEWDDFVSWKQQDGALEMASDGIGALEPLFASHDPADHKKGVALLVEERNKLAKSSGIALR